MSKHYDYWGNEVNIGNLVAFIDNRFSRKGEFSTGKIIKLTAQGIRISLSEDESTFRYDKYFIKKSEESEE